MLHHYSIVDIATLVFRDRFGCCKFLDLWRETVPFDDRDVNLRLARRSRSPPWICGERRGDVRRPRGDGCDRAGRTGPLARAGSPRRDAATREYLRTLVPPGEGRAPAGAYNVAAQLLAIEGGVDANPATARVHLTGRRWLHLRRPAGWAVAPTPATPSRGHHRGRLTAERIDLFARCCGLSPRETELLALLAAGHDTRDSRGHDGVSEHTSTTI